MTRRSPFLEELNVVMTESDRRCEAEDGGTLTLVLIFRQGFLEEMTSELRSKEQERVTPDAKGEGPVLCRSNS